MTDIPDDVMKVAWRLTIDDLCIDEPGQKQVDAVKFIARAILAERERCAKVAYAYADAHTSDHKIIGHIIGRKILFDTVDDGS